MAPPSSILKTMGGSPFVDEKLDSLVWDEHLDSVTTDFVYIMYYLPPLDVFYRAKMEYLTRWLACWYHLYKGNVIRFYLQLYFDPLDIRGRLNHWKELRFSDRM